MASRSWVFLYIIAHGDPWAWAYKIGITANVDARVAQLQTGNPHRLRIVRTVGLPDRSAAHDLERSMHETLAKFRIEGEWFACTTQDIVSAFFISAAKLGLKPRAEMSVGEVAQ